MLLLSNAFWGHKYVSEQKKMSQKYQLSSLRIAELCVSQGTIDLKKSDFIKSYPMKASLPLVGNSKLYFRHHSLNSHIANSKAVIFFFFLGKGEVSFYITHGKNIMAQLEEQN